MFYESDAGDSTATRESAADANLHAGTGDTQTLANNEVPLKEAAVAGEPALLWLVAGIAIAALVALLSGIGFVKRKRKQNKG
jgi:LPXTG-motif cell wall-anchored protein